MFKSFRPQAVHFSHNVLNSECARRPLKNGGNKNSVTKPCELIFLGITLDYSSSLDVDGLKCVVCSDTARTY